MLKEQFEKIPLEQRSMIAVSYLMENPELQLEDQKVLFQRLYNYDQNASRIKDAINQANRSIKELSPKFEQAVGAITAVAGIIAESLTAELVEKYCLAHDIKMPMQNQSQNVKPELDMAGSTAKDLPTPEAK